MDQTRRSLCRMMGLGSVALAVPVTAAVAVAASTPALAPISLPRVRTGDIMRASDLNDAYEAIEARLNALSAKEPA